MRWVKLRAAAQVQGEPDETMVGGDRHPVDRLIATGSIKGRRVDGIGILADEVVARDDFKVGRTEHVEASAEFIGALGITQGR